MTDAETFSDAAQVVMQRRGVSHAKAVCAVTDGAGMHWEPAHVNPMLALRTAACSERWDEAWQDTIQQQRSQLSTKRQQLAATRFRSPLASLLLVLLRFCRPSASHPWKQAPTCRPKLSAKK